MNNLRWSPYVFFNGNTTYSFWQKHFSNPKRKLLFILGKGFDVRMNIAIEALIKCCPSVNMDCWLIEFDEGSSSNSRKYQVQVDKNFKELQRALGSRSLIRRKISLWNNTSKEKKRRVGDRQAAQLLNNYDEISSYSDIIVDISALPRGVYFSLLGKFLSFIDTYGRSASPNFSIVVSENISIDTKIKNKGIDEDVDYLHGFGGQIGLASESEEPIIWFPILGEDKLEHLEKAHAHIQPNEICPILPFPSKNPRRSDSLIIDYHQLLFDKLSIEPQNLMYVPEQNPFEAYVRLINAIKNYNTSLKALNGCKAVISSFSSKLLSIGTLLAAYELKNDIGVGVLNVDSQGYEIEDISELYKLKDESELFLIWLTGEPYND